MDVSAWIDELLGLDIPAGFKRFGQALDAEWIDDALQETGTATEVDPDFWTRG